MTKPETESAPPEAFDVGLRLLARREHSRAELALKLAQRGIEQTEIERALDRLQAMDALNEERFAEQYMRMRLRQGYGPARIRADLAARGVDTATAEAELAGAEGDDAHWLARAEA
ncbi:MAG: regulatory protein RecX, partial [Gammaproteobacteria bacterium]